VSARELQLAAQGRAKVAMQRTPGALGAIDGAIAYGLNWMELLKAREDFAELMAAAKFVRDNAQSDSPEMWARLDAAFDRVEGRG